MNARDILNRFLLSQGERTAIDFSQLDADVAEAHKPYIDFATRRIQSQVRPYKDREKFHFFLIDSNEFGAFAVSVAGQHFVCLNGATLPSLSSYFSRVVAYFDIEASRWTEKEQPPTLTPWSGELVNAWRTGGALALPSDLNGQLHVVSMLRRSLEQIIDHEVGHIVLGHCDEKSFGIKRRMDDHIAVLDGNSARISQALEIQADQYSAYLAFMSYSDINHNTFSPTVRDIMARVEETPEAKIFLALFSFFSTFRLFDEIHWTKADLNCLSHPPAPIRAKSMFAGLMDHFDKQENDMMEAYHRALRRIIADSEKIFSRSVGLSSQDMFASVNDEINERHYALLRQHLKEISPSLLSMMDDADWDYG